MLQTLSNRISMRQSGITLIEFVLVSTLVAVVFFLAWQGLGVAGLRKMEGEANLVTDQNIYDDNGAFEQPPDTIYGNQGAAGD